jgi:hypothetical protein
MRVTRAVLYLFVVLTLLSVVGLQQVSPVLAGAPPNRLDYNGGAVLANPAIHNLYFDFSWDSSNPAAISRANIDGFTSSLVASNYFAKASQYGVGGAKFNGSSEATFLCPPPVIGGVTEFLSIEAWMICMTQPSPIPFTGTLTGIPAPDDNTVYAVYLPSGTQINDVAISSCGDFAAYHFFGNNLTWQWIYTPLPVPALLPQNFAYIVIPIDCAIANATNPMDGVSFAATHELIEAATDPIILQGWIDNSKTLFTGDILKEGEASDICGPGGDASSPAVTLTNGLVVAPYWSNADNGCVPVTHRIHLDESNLPLSVPHEATFDGSTVSLPFDTIVDDGTTHSYSFPSPINDPNPGIRYVTFEAPNANVTTDTFVIAPYFTQYFLTVDVLPSSAAPLDVSLTSSDWFFADTAVTLTTDPIINLGPDSRLRFDHWSGDASGASPTTTLVMDGPKNVTAVYVMQHLVTVSTSGLGSNDAEIFNDTTLLGTANDGNPLVVFVDAGPFALHAASIVNGTPGVRYVFQNFSPAPPAVLNAAFSTLATYSTQYFLTVDTIPSSAAPLDASLTPSDWQDAGTTVNLTTDAIINLDPGSRLRFDHWSGDVSSTSTATSILMDGPKSATANYVMQHLLTVKTSGLGTTDTHIFNGTVLLGTANDSNPLSLFLDDGPLALKADANVSRADGVQFFFQNFAPTPPSMLNTAVTTTAPYKTISQLIDDAIANGGIDGPGARGLANSFRLQFNRVQADIANGDYDQALHHLETFMNHVQAQSGKQITTELATTLQLDALLVYHSVLCMAISAGQINTRTANADYAYYRNLITSLGGTVLPPC